MLVRRPAPHSDVTGSGRDKFNRSELNTGYLRQIAISSKNYLSKLFYISLSSIMLSIGSKNALDAEAL